MYVCVRLYVFVVSSRAPTRVPRFCLGEIVIGGAIVQWDNDGAPLVAVSSTARKSYVGPLNKTDIADLDISYAVRDRAMISAILATGKANHSAGAPRRQ